jgi:hypothetical protein
MAPVPAASLWRAYQPYFALSANEFYIFRQCTYIAFILQCNESLNTTAKLYKKSRAGTGAILIIFYSVLCEVRSYIVTISYRRST